MDNKIISDTIAHLNGYAECVKGLTGYNPLAVYDTIEGLQAILKENSNNAKMLTKSEEKMAKEPITEKQINMLLNKLKYKGEVKTLSKLEARDLIDKLLNENARR
jgi:peroxiredoxin family protein